MRKFLIPILLLILTTSCGQKVECNGENEKERIKENLKKLLITKNVDIQRLINSNTNSNLSIIEVDSLIGGYVNFLELTNIRTLKIEKDINLCNCKTGLKLKSFDEFYKNLIEKGGFDVKNENDKNNLDLRRKEFSKEFEIEYNVQFTDDSKLFVDINKNSFLKNIGTYELFRAYFEMEKFNKEHSINSKNSNSTKTLVEDNPEKWLQNIFNCEDKTGKFCFPIESKVCSNRFLEFISESGEIYGASNLEGSELQTAEKNYLQKWKNIYPIIEDEKWLFGRGNGFMGDGSDILKNVEIIKVSNLDYKINIDFGNYKTENKVKLIATNQSYLIDYSETKYIE